MSKMKPKHKGSRLCACIGAMLCFLFLLPAGIVCADVTVPITPKNLPKTEATLTFTYSGEVSGLTVVTPDGRSFSGSPVETGTISIYIGDAPDGKYMLTIAGSFVTFQVSVSGTAAGTTAATTVAAPTPTPTPPPTPTPVSQQPTESGSVVTPTPTPRSSQTETSTSQGSAATTKKAEETNPTSTSTVTVVPLPIITEETTTAATTTETAQPKEPIVVPAQDKIDEFISTNIPTPQILVEAESYFSLIMIYAVIPLAAGGILGWGSYMAFGFYSIYNRKKRRLKKDEEEGIQF